MGVVLFVLTVGVGILARGIVTATTGGAGRRCDHDRRPPGPATPRLTPRPRFADAQVKNVVATGVIALAFVVALVPLVFLVVYVVQRGAKVISWSFLTDDIPFVDRLPAAAWVRRSSARS